MKTLLVALLVAAPASAQEVSPALKRLLASVDVPPTRPQLVEAGGRDTAMTLRALASNAREGVAVRRAAMSALGHFDEPATRATLAQLCRDVEPVVRKAAVATLGFLTAGGKDAALLQALHDEAPLVRRTAIVALGRSRDPEVRLALERRWAVEVDVETRALLGQALGR